MSREKMSDIWRSCNKIRAAVFRERLNLWNFFLPLDPKRNNLISESKFVSVFNGQLKEQVGLSEQEITELADYFRVHDGRIYYSQLCEVIQDSVPDFSENPPLVNGLEWDDPFQVNRLSMSEERRLLLLLTKIATMVNLRRLILRPYFQDYEIISKNNGTVTISHFARVLHYLNIRLSPYDFLLLVKKFIKDSYTINYISFLAAIDDIVNNLDNKLMLDLGGDLLSQYPGRAISAELPKLPRPEIGSLVTADIFGLQKTFHPIQEPKAESEDFLIVMKRIQRFVLSNRIRVREFFEQYDFTNCGRITVSQFKRGLDSMGVSALHRLYLSEPDIEMISKFYQDPNDHERVCWRTFEDDIDQVFTVKELEKFPSLQVETPPEEIISLPRKGSRNWGQVQENMRDSCEMTLAKLKIKINARRITLRPYFNDFDKTNNGHVSRSQFRQCLVLNGLLCSDAELYSLEQRYNDDMGFNYYKFINELEAEKQVEPLYQNLTKQLKILNTRELVCERRRNEKDIVEIIAKIKSQIVRKSVRVLEFLSDHDKHNEKCITRENFYRSLQNCQFDLTPTEIETVMDIFASPKRRNYVDYKRFCEVVEECMTQPDLYRAPLIIPVQHLPSYDRDDNFLNYEERQLLSHGMKKQSSSLTTDLLQAFREYDKRNCGTVSRENFLRALTWANLAKDVSSRELDAIFKCFSIERGKRSEFRYRDYCKSLETVRNTSATKPF